MPSPASNDFWPFPAPRTDLEERVVGLILDARHSRTKKHAHKFLSTAMGLLAGIKNSEHPRSAQLRLELQVELAKHGATSLERRNRWQAALRNAQSALSSQHDDDLAIAASYKSVDACQDDRAGFSERERMELLATAKRTIEPSIRTIGTEAAARALAARSGLLRMQSALEKTRSGSSRIAEESIRCAEKANKLNPQDWSGELQLGLCFFNSSRFESSDVRFAERLQGAEQHIAKSVELCPNRVNHHALAQFFRNTYQSAPFVAAFRAYAEFEYNRADLLRQSYLFAEGALQLFYGGYHETLVRNNLEDADRLIEEAIAADYADARHVVDLAFIKAALGDVEVGTLVARSLFPNHSEIHWDVLAQRIADESANADVLAAGLSLGIENASIWNKLGTFSRRFLKDNELAITLYRASLRLRPNNAIALTNLAKSLLEQPGGFEEARRLVSKAATFADRRYRWWKPLREEIEKEDGIAVPEVVGTSSIRSISDLRRWYKALEFHTSLPNRGEELHHLAESLWKRSVSNSPATAAALALHSKLECRIVEGYFSVHREPGFSLHAFWSEAPLPRSRILAVVKDLQAQGRSGAVLSPPGFEGGNSSIMLDANKRTTLALLDGDDIQRALLECPPLDEVLRRKQLGLVLSAESTGDMPLESDPLGES